jgi:hypothetical protein
VKYPLQTVRCFAGCGLACSLSDITIEGCFCFTDGYPLCSLPVVPTAADDAQRQTQQPNVTNPMNQNIYETNLRSFPFPKPLDYEDVPVFGTLPELLRSLQRTLGLDVRFIRTGGTLPLDMIQGLTVPVEGGKSPGQLVLMPAGSQPRLTESERSDLLKSIAALLGEMYRWQQSVRLQEEKILPFPAAGRERLTESSLFDTLKQSAKLLGCCAAALYRLDAADKTVKACSVWGLPEERLLDTPRPLHDSLADVEAVLGQTIVLNEDYLFEVWQPPENFPMALCVPIISPSAVLGTLWLYSEVRRDLTDNDFELLEYIAGRITAQWELILIERQTAAICLPKKAIFNETGIDNCLNRE